jgi:hypothetical protein
MEKAADLLDGAILRGMCVRCPVNKDAQMKYIRKNT